MITSNKRIRQRKSAVLDHKYQMLRLKEIQELVVKTSKAIVLAVLPVCDPT